MQTENTGINRREENCEPWQAPESLWYLNYHRRKDGPEFFKMAKPI